jgi:ammonium transporter, Amt family
MKRFLLLMLLLLSSSGAGFAEESEAPAISAGDTAWVLTAAALVMLMTPGLAFFYGGMVKKKNILSVLMQCFIIMGIMGIHWVLIGYSLSFAPGNAFIGGFDFVGLKGIGLEAGPYADTIPHQAFIIFQAMFAIITPALIIGAFAERIRFFPFVIFSLLWATFVYAPVCHWVWGTGGWLDEMGALDFAGGTVVHINAGIAALVTAFVIGKRRKTTLGPTPHNLPFTVLGTALLWFGWFGFNAGSSLAADGLAANAFLVTNTAAAAAAICWAFLEWIFSGKPTILGTVTGAVGGLVAITPAAGFVSVIPAMIIGITASMVCYFMVSIIKHKLGYDDALDAFGVHGVGGAWGALLTGVFANAAIGGTDGLIHGNAAQMIPQIVSIIATAAYSFVATFIIFKSIDLVVGVRSPEKDEALGLDLSEHNERAYTLVE